MLDGVWIIKYCGLFVFIILLSAILKTSETNAFLSFYFC
jgi:hypothetical protein